MTKNLYINMEQLEAVINAGFKLRGKELKNEAQGFYRYYIEKEGRGFTLDVYYTRKKGTTVISKCDDGRELEQAIVNSIEYKDVKSGSFSASISENVFNSLIGLLRQSPNVTVLDPEDKGNNGIIYKVNTDFGDTVTLTYFKTTSRMLYQGLFMKLYSIIKSYLLASNGTITETTHGEWALEDKVEDHIKTHFPKGWTSLEPTIQGFIKDSFTLLEVNTELNDYAAWVMPVIRVLEYRIKKICLDYNIIIDDTKGFKYYTNGSTPRAMDWIFVMDFQTDTVTGVNPDINNMPVAAKDTIVECYDFLRKNRHEMFHATQILAGMKLVETRDEALQTIIETCEEIEKSVIYNMNVSQ